MCDDNEPVEEEGEPFVAIDWGQEGEGKTYAVGGFIRGEGRLYIETESVGEEEDIYGWVVKHLGIELDTQHSRYLEDIFFGREPLVFFPCRRKQLDWRNVATSWEATFTTQLEAADYTRWLESLIGNQERARRVRLDRGRDACARYLAARPRVQRRSRAFCDRQGD